MPPALVPASVHPMVIVTLLLSNAPVDLAGLVRIVPRRLVAKNVRSMATVSMDNVSVRMATLVINATSKPVLMLVITMVFVIKGNANVTRTTLVLIVG